jgi:hypothetical protein
MSKKILLSPCLFLICIILIGTGTANADGSTIAVVPSSQNVDAPDLLFTVNFTITGAPTMTQWIVRNITWNPAVCELQTLNKSSFVEGPFMKSVGSTTGLLTKAPDNVTGRAPEVSCGFMGSETVSGDGVLFTIKFRSKAVGYSNVSMQIAYLLNGLNMLPDPALQNGTVTVIPEFSNVLLPIFLVATTMIAYIAATLTRKRRAQIRVP